MVEILKQAYQKEMLDALRAERAAEALPYPHLKAKVLEVAKRERAHAEALAEALRGLGAALPPVPAPEELGYEALLKLLAEEGFERSLYLESTLPEPELEALFTRLGQEEALNQEAIREVIRRL